MKIEFLTYINRSRHSETFYASVEKHASLVNVRVLNRESLTEKECANIYSGFDALFDKVIVAARTFEDFLSCWMIAQSPKREYVALLKAQSVAKTPEEEIRVWGLSRPSQPLPLSNEALTLLQRVSEYQDSEQRSGVVAFLASLVENKKEVFT